jgi:hypothetical protein
MSATKDLPFLGVLEKDSIRLNAVLANLQVMADHRNRRDIARMLAHIGNQLLPRRFPDGSGDAGTRMVQEGCAALGSLLTQDQSRSILAHFRSRPLHKAHVFAGGDAASLDFDTAAATLSHAGYAFPDVVNAPYLLELANSDRVLALVESYLGCRPTLYSMNAFWSFPGSHPLRPDLQKFHRDRDDFKFCTLFILLTDASRDDGTHWYLRYSHDPDILKTRIEETDRALASSLDINGLFTPRSDLDELCTGALGGFLAPFNGPAGTAVLQDTYGLHRGDKPKGPRLLFWARYGLFANKTYHVDGRALGGVPAARYAGRVDLADEYYLFVNRLLLTPPAEPR